MRDCNLMRAFLLSAFLSLHLPNTTFAQMASAENLSDRELMVLYGSIIRGNYKAGTSIGESQPLFLELEAEVERRKLVTSTSLEEIEKGLMYIGMPSHQVFGVLDELVQVELYDFEGMALELFRGKVYETDASWPARESVLFCNGLMIGFGVQGLQTLSDHRRIQTNFGPSFFVQGSATYQAYIRKGRRPPSVWSIGAQSRTRGPYQLITELLTGQRTIITKKDLHLQWHPPRPGPIAELIDSHIRNGIGGFPFVLDYFKRSCSQ